MYWLMRELWTKHEHKQFLYSENLAFYNPVSISAFNPSKYLKYKHILTLQFLGMYSKRMTIIHSFRRLFILTGIIRAFKRIIYKTYFISHWATDFLLFLHWSIQYKHAFGTYYMLCTGKMFKVNHAHKKVSSVRPSYTWI
jgi:hypothetical protein